MSLEQSISLHLTIYKYKEIERTKKNYGWEKSKCVANPKRGCIFLTMCFVGVDEGRGHNISLESRLVSLSWFGIPCFVSTCHIISCPYLVCPYLVLSLCRLPVCLSCLVFSWSCLAFCCLFAFPCGTLSATDFPPFRIY
jgi:hypothetical protein